MKIYIAGKIGSAGVAAMRHHFDAAAEALRAQGWEVVNPCDIQGSDTWRACMIADLHALLDCDALYALRSFPDSPGAKIEVALAMGLGHEMFGEGGEVEGLGLKRAAAWLAERKA